MCTQPGLQERRCPPLAHKARAHASTHYTCAHNSSTAKAGQQTIPASCRNHIGTAGAAHRHARAGLRERSGRNPTRGACAYAEPQAPTPSVHTDPANTIIPALCRNPASRHNRCSAKARTSGLAGAEQAKTHSQSTRTHTARSITEGTSSPTSTIIPASCRNPASRHSRCSAQARASGLAGAERAKTHSRSTRNMPGNLTASRGQAAERQR